MRIKPVDALPEVAGDLATAAAHYQSWRTDGQEHILQKYDETVSWIAWNPDQFPRCRFGGVRRAILKQSYYIVYFLDEAKRSLVLAVLDGRRSPAVIKRLLHQRTRRSD